MIVCLRGGLVPLPIRRHMLCTVVDQEHVEWVATGEIREGRSAMSFVELFEGSIDGDRVEVGQGKAVQREQHLLAARQRRRLTWRDAPPNRMAANGRLLSVAGPR